MAIVGALWLLPMPMPTGGVFQLFAGFEVGERELFIIGGDVGVPKEPGVGGVFKCGGG